MAKQKVYFCIDMKTFYASVECAERGLNPFETNLVVADVTRGKFDLMTFIRLKKYFKERDKGKKCCEMPHLWADEF